MISVDLVPVVGMSAADVDAWHGVEDRAAEGNAFMSASFVIPAVRFLAPGRDVRVLVAREGDTWLAALPVERVLGSRRIPMPHLRAFWCSHTYLTGPLIDAARGVDALAAVGAWLGAHRRRFPAVELLQRPADGPVAAALGAAWPESGRWVEYGRWERAAVVCATSRAPAETWSRNQRKKLKRSRVRLSAAGPVDFDTIWNTSGYEASVDTFLVLEAMGWKGAQSSAMASHRETEAFLRDMLERFGARRSSFVSQLRVGTRVIAASVNLVSGREGYGFKLGWDLAFAHDSPGTTHEFEYVGRAAGLAPRLTRIDATSDPGSFVDAIWPDRRGVCSGAFTFGRAAHGVVVAARAARDLVRRG